MSAPEGRRRRLEHLTPAEIEPLEALFEPDYPEIMLNLARVIYVELLNQDTPAPELLAHQLTEAVRLELGGRMAYLTKGVRLEASRRAREIQAAFNGRNIPLLAAQHGLSDARVRQILQELQPPEVREARAKQEADLRSRQGTLPLDPETTT